MILLANWGLNGISFPMMAFVLFNLLSMQWYHWIETIKLLRLSNIFAAVDAPVPSSPVTGLKLTSNTQTVSGGW